MAATPDAELVARCREGDAEAWHELVDRFSRYVFAIVGQGYGLRGDDAEDVFQEVFSRVFERLDTLRSDDAVRPWIAQLARRCAVDRLRSASRELPVEDVPEERYEETIALLDEAMAVREALAELTPECAEILDRFFARDESYRTIGEALDLPAGTIASRISRCLAKLRERLEGRNRSSDPSSVRVT